MRRLLLIALTVSSLTKGPDKMISFEKAEEKSKVSNFPARTQRKRQRRFEIEKSTPVHHTPYGAMIAEKHLYSHKKCKFRA